MKRFLIILACIPLFSNIQAQEEAKNNSADIIVTRDNQRIDVYIAGADDYIVYYYTNEQGKGNLYQVPVNNIAAIAYANGEVKIFKKLIDEEWANDPNNACNEAQYRRAVEQIEKK